MERRKARKRTAFCSCQASEMEEAMTTTVTTTDEDDDDDNDDDDDHDRTLIPPQRAITTKLGQHKNAASSATSDNVGSEWGGTLALFPASR